MKKFLMVLFVFLLFVSVCFVLIRKFSQSTDQLLSEHITANQTVSLSPTSRPVKNVIITKSLFVPYWSLGTKKIDDASYNQLVYFGLQTNASGIDRTDDGYIHLKRFLSLARSHAKKLLAVRMIDSDSNFKILANPNLEKTLIDQSTAIAKQNGFSGIVLDLEVSALPFDSLIQQISTFEESFDRASKKQNETFAMTLYGDTFYRLRPFDVKTIAAHADQVMIMSYDFSKAHGNPGPNFPLSGANTYGYDMAKMTDDFLQFIPPQKLTIIFGLFGYDWVVDGKEKAIGTASPLSYKQIQQKFLENCSLQDCIIMRDPLSSEMVIHYTDADKMKHIVWFDDSTSVGTKQAFLKPRGIGAYSYWAYSYF